MLHIKEVFNLRGRFGRGEYIIYGNIIPWSLVFIIEKEIITNGFMIIIICILCFIFVLNSTIKRFHDVNMTAWSILLLFIPLLNIIIAIHMFIFKGDPNKNEYGQPLK